MQALNGTALNDDTLLSQSATQPIRALQSRQKPVSDQPSPVHRQHAGFEVGVWNAAGETSCSAAPSPRHVNAELRGDGLQVVPVLGADRNSVCSELQLARALDPAGVARRLKAFEWGQLPEARSEGVHLAPVLVRVGEEADLEHESEPALAGGAVAAGVLPSGGGLSSHGDKNGPAKGDYGWSGIAYRVGRELTGSQIPSYNVAIMFGDVL